MTWQATFMSGAMIGTDITIMRLQFKSLKTRQGHCKVYTGFTGRLLEELEGRFALLKAPSQ